jgi:hypothetical protein
MVIGLHLHYRSLDNTTSMVAPRGGGRPAMPPLPQAQEVTRRRAVLGSGPSRAVPGRSRTGLQRLHSVVGGTISAWIQLRASDDDDAWERGSMGREGEMAS